jgi:hypothetical protein
MQIVSPVMLTFCGHCNHRRLLQLPSEKRIVLLAKLLVAIYNSLKSFLYLLLPVSSSPTRGTYRVVVASSCPLHSRHAS